MKKLSVESINFSFDGTAIAQLSTLLNEAESGIETALNSAVPLMLNGLADRVGQGLTPAGLLGLVREAHSAGVLGQLTDLCATNWQKRGTNLLFDLLGDGYRGAVNQIAVVAGIRPLASDTLLQVTATAVAGVLGHQAVENKFSPTDFMHWLQAEKEAIGAAMLPLTGPSTGPAGRPERRLVRQALRPLVVAPEPEAAGLASPEYGPIVPEGPSRLRWQWGAMLLVAVCMGYFFGRGMLAPISQPVPVAFMAAPTALATNQMEDPITSPASFDATIAQFPEPRRESLEPPRAAARLTAAPGRPARPYRPSSVRDVTVPSAGGRYDHDQDTYIYDTGRPIVLTLADGTTQEIGANSTENRLYTFLALPAMQVDSVNRTKGWINFDRINFKTGEALLTPESALQLGNIARILNTFPRAVVKIGGYTDSTGEALGNYQLSEARARAAMLTLASMGVSAERLEAKGYGPKYFVQPNNTPTGRSLNRRVSLRVLRK